MMRKTPDKEARKLAIAPPQRRFKKIDTPEEYVTTTLSAAERLKRDYPSASLDKCIGAVIPAAWSRAGFQRLIHGHPCDTPEVYAESTRMARMCEVVAIDGLSLLMKQHPGAKEWITMWSFMRAGLLRWELMFRRLLPFMRHRATDPVWFHREDGPSITWTTVLQHELHSGLDYVFPTPLDWTDMLIEMLSMHDGLIHQFHGAFRNTVVHIPFTPSAHISSRHGTMFPLAKCNDAILPSFGRHPQHPWSSRAFTHYITISNPHINRASAIFDGSGQYIVHTTLSIKCCPLCAKDAEPSVSTVVFNATMLASVLRLRGRIFMGTFWCAMRLLGKARALHLKGPEGAFPGGSAYLEALADFTRLHAR